VVLTGAQRDRRLDQRDESAHRVPVGPGLFDHRREILGDALIQCGVDQVALRRKPSVQCPFADTRAARDGLHRRLGPQFAVHVPGGPQYALGIARRIGAQRPIVYRGHRRQV
jgi:hypothetical protein